MDYERQRQMQCLARLLSVDSLNRLYSTKFSPIVALRSVGLSFVNEFSPFKVNLNIYLIQIHIHFFRNSLRNKRLIVLD